MDRETKLAVAGAAIARREQKRQENGGSGGKTEKGNLMRAIFGIFPLLVIPVALYNLLAIGFGGSVEMANEFGEIIRADSAPILSLLNDVFSVCR